MADCTFDRLMCGVNPEPRVGWIPFRIRWDNDRPEVSWCRAEEGQFTAPFFEQTVRNALRVCRPVVTSLDYLEAVAVTLPPAQPAGFVFHCSRCGSTLLGRLLARAPESVMFSEPAPLDDVLGALHAPIDARVRWLQAILTVLSAAARQPRRVFVKWDAWHILDRPVIAHAFPQVPWTFLMRDPVDVLVSHQRMPGMHMLPAAVAPGRFGWTLQQVVGFTPLEYRSRVLGTLFGVVLDHASEGGALVLDYRDLPAVALEQMLPHFGIRPTAEELDYMAEVFTQNAKAPAQAFVPDSVSKQAEASEALHAAVHEWAAPVYAKLLKLISARADLACGTGR